MQKARKGYTRKALGKALAENERKVGEQVQFGMRHYVVVRIEPSREHPDRLEEATFYLQLLGPLE